MGDYTNIVYSKLNGAIAIGRNSSSTITANTGINNLMHFTSSLKMIKELIDDFQNDEPKQAVDHEKELNRLRREIDRMQVEIRKMLETDRADADKKPLLVGIKERWESFVDLAKQCNYVTGIGEKAVKAGIWLAGIYSK